MEKSDAYVTPGHLKSVALFFKQPKTAHANRKKIWAGAFTGSRYSIIYDGRLDIILTLQWLAWLTFYLPLKIGLGNCLTASSAEGIKMASLI